MTIIQFSKSEILHANTYVCYLINEMHMVLSKLLKVKMNVITVKNSVDYYV